MSKMKSSYNAQKEHELLIDALQQTYLKGRFKKHRTANPWYEPSCFDINSLNDCVFLISLAMNTTGGSVSDVDLYKLLQAYILDPSKRSEINEILKK